MKTLIIIPYFGKLPNYFPLWLKTVKFNQNFNWLLFLDDKTKIDFPSNVKIEYTSFNTLKERIISKFDFDISLNSPYKLCDFRPAYGYLFSEYLLKYDFWGYGDLDLLYGDLDKYLSENILNKYDKLFPNGHLSLYRNNDKMNTVFKLKVNNSPYYKDVFSSPESFCFDEWPGITSMIKKEGIRQLETNYMADISWHSFNLKHDKHEFKNYKNQMFLWEKGAVYQVYSKDNSINYKEFAYIHLQKRNMNISNLIVSEALKIIVLPNSFKIINDDTLVDTSLINKYLSFRIIDALVFYKEYFNRRMTNLKKKIGKG